MFPEALRPKKSELDIVIDELVIELNKTDKGTPEYAAMVDQLVKLSNARQNTRTTVSPDVLATIAGNLAGILLIVGYEHSHVITSKALSFVGKFR